MKSLILLCIICLQIGWSYSEPKGVGAYVYKDKTGNRYSGTYGLNDAQVHQRLGTFVPPPFAYNIQNTDDFFPEYFNNFENILNDASTRGASFRTVRELDPLSASPHQRPTRSIFSPFSFLPPLPPLPPLEPLSPLRPLIPFRRMFPLSTYQFGQFLPYLPFHPFSPFPPFHPFSSFSPFPSYSPFPSFSPFPPFPNFPSFSSYSPFPPFHPVRHYKHIEDVRIFKTNFENQRLAIIAAKKAYDLTSNQAGYIPYFPSRFNNFGAFRAFPPFPNMMNSAFASGMAGPGFSHQIAAINPSNPLQENVNVVNRFADTSNNPDGGFYSVSSSSYSSSSNIDGVQTNHRKSETIVNNNGHVTEYRVES